MNPTYIYIEEKNAPVDLTSHQNLIVEGTGYPSGLVQRSKAPSSVFGCVSSMKVAPSQPLGALPGAFLGALGALLGSPGGLLGRSWRGFAAPRSRRERKSRKYGFRYISAAKTLCSTSEGSIRRVHPGVFIREDPSGIPSRSLPACSGEWATPPSRRQGSRSS